MRRFRVALVALIFISMNALASANGDEDCETCKGDEDDNDCDRCPDGSKAQCKKGTCYCHISRKCEELGGEPKPEGCECPKGDSATCILIKDIWTCACPDCKDDGKSNGKDDGTDDGKKG